MCIKLYQSPDLKNLDYLVGGVPKYLITFFEGMNNQAEGFRLNCIRTLRTTADKVLVMCEQVPWAIFSYL
jgi:hypothetical protein